MLESAKSRQLRVGVPPAYDRPLGGAQAQGRHRRVQQHIAAQVGVQLLRQQVRVVLSPGIRVSYLYHPLNTVAQSSQDRREKAWIARDRRMDKDRRVERIPKRDAAERRNHCRAIEPQLSVTFSSRLRPTARRLV